MKYLTCGHTDFETYLLGRLSLLEEKKDVVDGICYIHIFKYIYTIFIHNNKFQYMILEKIPGGLQHI